MNNPNCGKCGMLSNTGYCKLTACIYPCQSGMGGYINKPATNGDRIRAMTNKELVDMLVFRMCPWCLDKSVQCTDSGCERCWTEWIEKESVDVVH